MAKCLNGFFLPLQAILHASDPTHTHTQFLSAPTATKRKENHRNLAERDGRHGHKWQEWRRKRGQSNIRKEEYGWERERQRQRKIDEEAKWSVKILNSFITICAACSVHRINELRIRVDLSVAYVAMVFI